MFFKFLEISSTLSTSSTLKDESSSLLLDNVCEIGLNGLGVVGERLQSEKGRLTGLPLLEGTLFELGKLSHLSLWQESIQNKIEIV